MKTNPNAIVIEGNTIYYPNGAIAKIKNGHHIYTRYNTGDEIWLKPIGETLDDERVRVVKLKSYDGWYWEEGMTRAITKKQFWTSLIPLGVLILMVVGVVVKNYWF